MAIPELMAADRDLLTESLEQLDVKMVAEGGLQVAGLTSVKLNAADDMKQVLIVMLVFIVLSYFSFSLCHGICSTVKIRNHFFPIQ